MNEARLIVLELAVAIGGPVLIALLAPRRWRLWIAALWVIAPLLILIAVAAGELVTGKTRPADIDKLVYGVLLIASFAAAPWLGACGLGYGLGVILRGRGQPAAVRDPPAEAPPPDEPPQPAPIPTVGTPLIDYAPPAGTEGPNLPAPEPSGASADGTLRFEHDEVKHHRGSEPFARLFDARSGALLFEGAVAQSSQIAPQSDGSLLLCIAHREWQSVFRIDPAARSFRDLAGAESERPLEELAGAAAAALVEAEEQFKANVGRQVALDGSLVVELQAVEWSNTHWVRSPRVIEVATGRVLLDLWRTDWDAWPTFPRTRTVHLSLRRYRFGGAAEVELELDAERYLLFEGAGAVAGPIDELPEALESVSGRAAAQAPPRPAIAPRRPSLRNGLMAVLIVVGVFAFIAIATLISMRLKGEPAPQKLDTIPPMPGER